MANPLRRSDAEALDATDPLAAYRERFVITDPDLVYMDGNSLGMAPQAALDAVTRAAATDWAAGLVRSWHHWLDLAVSTGDVLAPLIGASPGEVVLTDQTSINLYKLASAAVAARDGAVVTDTSNFPSDIYVLRSVASHHGREFRLVDTDHDTGPTPENMGLHVTGAALVSLSHVAFKSGFRADLTALTELAHGGGALMLWDLSHSAGVLPVRLDTSGADLAVGCTYKYLNGGPGSPAFLYVRRDLQQHLEQPIQGWFGHADQFAFEADYRPAPDIRRFATGTPAILSLAAARAGIELTAEATVDAIHDKARRLTTMFITLCGEQLGDLGFDIVTPRGPFARGAHVTLRHAAGYGIARALIDRNVVPDFRAPDLIRFGMSPLTTRYADVWEAAARCAAVVESGGFAPEEPDTSRVT